MQGSWLSTRPNLDQLLTGLNERDRIVEREEKKRSTSGWNRHCYNIQGAGQGGPGIDHRVGIQAQEIMFPEGTGLLL